MTKKDWGIDDPNETYWFNTKTREVESGPQSLGSDRLGPFKTAEEAANAEAVIADRARQIREEEEREEREKWGDE